MLTEKRRIYNREYLKKWRALHPEKCRGYQQKWRKNNRQQILASRAKYRKENKEKLAEGYRRHILKKRFGISKEEYDQMLETQNNVCAICGLLCLTGRSLAVDHNHQNGKIRGLLCRDCNVSIGLMKDNPDRLRAAAEYVESQESI